MNEKCLDPCPLVPRVEALEEANKQHGSTHREVFDRLRTLETQTAVQENKLDTILDKLDALTVKVSGLEAKPGKRWDGLVDKLLYTAAGAALMWIAAGMPGVGS